MSLREELSEKMKAAMRSRDAKRLSVLRMVLSELNVADASGQQYDEVSVVKAYAKKLKNTVEEYQRLALPDKVREAQEELRVVEEFLPQQMSQAEIEKLVVELIERENFGPRDIGRLMKAVMGEHGDRADGRLVQQIAKEKLAQRDA